MLPCDPLTSLPHVPAAEFDRGGQHVDIWWWPYSARVDWGKIRSKLTSDEQTRAATFYFARDAIAFMAGRYLQRSVLAKYTSIAPRDLNIAVGPRGKPYLPDAGIAVNLTNAEGLAAVAISRNAKMLGIDAEPVKRVIEPGVSSLFCSPAELQILSTLQGSERQSLLLIYWTLKESFLKAVGTGLMAAPDQLNVRLDRTTNALRIDNGLTADDTHWDHRSLFSPSGHLIAISVQSDQAKLFVRQRELPDPE
jgi:4'-phosphopantetheinyl transferase